MDKDLLFKARLPEGEIDVPGVGTVRVRGLTRGEVFAVQEVKGVAYAERKILALGMLDPELTETEAGRWQESSPAGEMEPVVELIRELSGLAEDAPKTAMRSFRDGQPAGDGVRSLPGAEAVDDSGAAQGVDG
jgi:hypothetical protein